MFPDNLANDDDTPDKVAYGVNAPVIAPETSVALTPPPPPPVEEITPPTIVIFVPALNCPLTSFVKLEILEAVKFVIFKPLPLNEPVILVN